MPHPSHIARLDVALAALVDAIHESPEPFRPWPPTRLQFTQLCGVVAAATELVNAISTVHLPAETLEERARNRAQVVRFAPAFGAAECVVCGQSEARCRAYGTGHQFHPRGR